MELVKKALGFAAVAGVGFVLLQLAKRVPVVGAYVGKLGV